MSESYGQTTPQARDNVWNLGPGEFASLTLNSKEYAITNLDADFDGSAFIVVTGKKAVTVARLPIQTDRGTPIDPVPVSFLHAVDDEISAKHPVQFLDAHAFIILPTNVVHGYSPRLWLQLAQSLRVWNLKLHMLPSFSPSLFGEANDVELTRELSVYRTVTDRFVFKFNGQTQWSTELGPVLPERLIETYLGPQPEETGHMRLFDGHLHWVFVDGAYRAAGPDGWVIKSKIPPRGICIPHVRRDCHLMIREGEDFLRVRLADGNWHRFVEFEHRGSVRSGPQRSHHARS